MESRHKSFFYFFNACETYAELPSNISTKMKTNPILFSPNILIITNFYSSWKHATQYVCTVHHFWYIHRGCALDWSILTLCMLLSAWLKIFMPKLICYKSKNFDQGKACAGVLVSIIVPIFGGIYKYVAHASKKICLFRGIHPMCD